MTADVYVDRAIIDYAVALTTATREPEPVGLPKVKPFIAYGASPRGSINLIHAARALAVARGRRYVIPTDVTELAHDVLRHRIVPSFTALAEEVTRGHDPRPAHPGRAGAADQRGGADRMAERRLTSALASAGPARRPRPGPARRRRRSSARSTSRSGARSTASLPGEFRAHDRGGGTELAQIRPYEPGDDVRQIDWNVTARTTVPARPGPRPGAGADVLAAARRLAVDDVRDRRPAQGRRRRGRRAGGRPPGHAARQPARDRRRSAVAATVRLQPTGGRQGLLARCSPPATMATVRRPTTRAAPRGAVTPASALRSSATPPRAAASSSSSRTSAARATGRRRWPA